MVFKNVSKLWLFFFYVYLKDIKEQCFLIIKVVWQYLLDWRFCLKQKKYVYVWNLFLFREKWVLLPYFILYLF